MPTRSCHGLDSHIIDINLMLRLLARTFEQEVVLDVIVKCDTVCFECGRHYFVDLKTLQDGIRTEFYSRFTVSLIEQVELFDALLAYLSIGYRR